MHSGCPACSGPQGLLLLYMISLDQIFRKFWGVFREFYGVYQPHNCGSMRREHMGAYHTAARPNPGPFQCLIVKFQGISGSERNSQCCKTTLGSNDGPSLLDVYAHPKGLHSLPSSTPLERGLSIHCLGVWGGSCGLALAQG